MNLVSSRVTQADGTTLLAMTVSWIASSGPLLGSYEVQWSEDGGTTWGNDGNVGASATSSVLSPALANTAYMAQVRAISQNGLAVSAWTQSAVVNSGALVGSVPAAPTALMATAGAANATLAWTAPADPTVTGFHVYRAAGLAAVFSAASVVATVGPSPWTDTGVAAATAYTWWVTALNAAGESAASGSASCTTGALAGVVTALVAGVGLAGGTITSTGTVSLAPIGTGSLLANTGTASAVPVAATPSAVLDAAFGAAEGMVLYRGAAGWAALAPGAAGELLQSGGTTAAPSWVAAGAGAAVAIENAGTAEGSATTLNAGSGMSVSVTSGVATFTASGGGGGPAPVIVQSMGIKQNTTITLTLPAPPTVGNILFLVAVGYNGVSAETPPPGFTQIVAANEVQYQSAAIWMRAVAAGDGTSYTLSGMSDYTSAVLIEVSGLAFYQIAHGSPSISSDTFTAVLAPMTSANLHVVVFETDTMLTFSGASVSLALLFNGAPGTVSNHSCMFYTAAPSALEVLSVTASTTPAYPIYMTLALYGPI